MFSHHKDWFLSTNEPWTRYRYLVDLCDLPEQDQAVQLARQEMLQHPLVIRLIEESKTFFTIPIKRHNDANLPLHKLSVLADFGITANDPGIAPLLKNILDQQHHDGGLQSLLNVPQSFGGSGVDQWSWMSCDSPTLLYVLAKMKVSDEPRLTLAYQHLVSLSDEQGWCCKVAPELGKFRGPGKKGDPCPIVNLLALKAITQFTAWQHTQFSQRGIEMLLQHWENRKMKKYYLFGMGTDFCKLKYPFIWYDILHVVEVLSQYEFARHDRRFLDMLSQITTQADEKNHLTAGSMYQAWKDWPFSNKKCASPWLTFLVARIQKRCSQET